MSKRFLRAALAFGALALPAFLLSQSLFAKEVVIRWKAMPEAISYELRVEKDDSAGSSVVAERNSETEWKGELPPGSYSYRVRAIDRIKRPGKWASAHPLIVLPAPPRPKSPEDGGEVTHYAPGVSTLLQWEPVPGAKGYVLQIRKEGRLIHPIVREIATDTPWAKVPGLDSGKFTWEVRARIVPKGRIPASFSEKKLLTGPSVPREFEIVPAKLSIPKPIYPVKTIPPTHDGRLRFTWDAVEGAQAYEFRISRAPEPGALTEPRERKFLVGANWIVLPLKAEGDYRWKVRALAHFEANRSPAAVGPESVADFRVDPKALFSEGSGYVALSSMYAPYVYQVSSGSLNMRSNALNSTALTMRASGEYWFGGRFGMGLAGEETYFKLNGFDLTRSTFELNGRYRLSLNNDPYGWFLAAHLGLESRDYVELVPPPIGSYGVLNYLGAGLGLDLRKQFNPKMSVGIKANYYLPFLRLSMTPPAGSNVVSTTLTPDLSYRNVSVGAQGLYWLSPAWGLALGGYFEMRSLSYVVNNAPAPEMVTMDGEYFFGSVIYRFGNR